MPEIIRQLHKTSVAAQMLCLSQGHLHRLKASQDGPLKEGENWFSGIAPNSPIRWDVAAIQQLLHRRGQARRLADKALAEAGISASNLSEVG